MSITQEKWVWYGSAGHLCVGDNCQFHLATKVGKYMVSTIGDYLPTRSKVFKDLGSGRMYETMVFEIDGECMCGCCLPTHAGDAFDSRGYVKRSEANRGHYEMCLKIAKLGGMKK